MTAPTLGGESPQLKKMGGTKLLIRRVRCCGIGYFFGLRETRVFTPHSLAAKLVSFVLFVWCIFVTCVFLEFSYFVLCTAHPHEVE